MRQSTRRVQTHALAIAAILALMLLTGCSLPYPFPQPTPDPKLPDAQQSFRPLEIGPNAGDLATLDPALINFGVDYQIAQLIFPQLVTLDAQGKPFDWAAERHEVSADGLTYTFHLRKEMQWSDGSPIDATTFAYSINRALDPCTGSDVASYLYNIEGAQAFNEGICPMGAIKSAATLVGSSLLVPDPLTLRILLERPAGYFLAALTYPTSWAVPQSLVERYTTPAPPPSYPGQFPPVTSTWTAHLSDNGGFGGNLFKLTHWEHQSQLDLARNERFWGRRPLLKEIHYALFRDISAAWQAYKNGAGDAGYPLAAELALARSLKGSSLQQTPQLAFSYLSLNWKQPPFDDIRVRQAFWLVVDREAIAHDVFQDSIQPTIHFMPEGLPGYNSDLQDPIGRKGKEALTADPATARRLATEYAAERCGGSFAKCPPIQYYVPYVRPASTLLAQALQTSWQNAFPGWSLAPYQRGLQIKSLNLQLIHVSWGADYPDPQDFASLLWTTGASYNRSQASIPQVDQLCAQADGMSDLNARIPLYQQAEQLLVNQVAAIPYAQPLNTYVVRSRVVGWNIASMRLTPLSVWQSAYIKR